jgi:hypothetical protein
MDAEVRREFDEIRAILRAIAERQAAADVRMNRSDARMTDWVTRMDRAEKRMDRADARMDRMEAHERQMDARFEKRMQGFEKLVQIGMREIVKLGRAQQRTENSLRAFMDSLRRGGNGRNGRAR